MNSEFDMTSSPDESTIATLREIARRHGTPTYAFDVGRLRRQVAKLRRHLPTESEIFYSLKANASLGICDVFAECGIGADVASAGELATAIEAGFPPRKIFVAGPFKLPETISQLHETPDAIVSVDSMSELRMLTSAGLPNPFLLRLRPDFGSCAVVQAGSESRFGFTCQDLDQCGQFIRTCNCNIVGFHVFAGSQVLDAHKVNDHLRQAMDLCERAAEVLGIEPTWINLGGGFGIPYGPGDQELALAQVGGELNQLAERVPSARLMLELGRYLVAEAGWYMTSVLGHQTLQGRPAVVVDGGVHQRADMCGLCLRSNQNAPIVINTTNHSNSPLNPTDVLGCLSLPDDVMIESTPLPPLSTGDVIAFGNAGAYGLWSSPVMFHGSPLPAEVAFEGEEVHVMRHRKPALTVLDDQLHVRQKQASAPQ